MKKTHFIRSLSYTIIIVLAISACSNDKSFGLLRKTIEKEIEMGDYKNALTRIENHLKENKLNDDFKILKAKVLNGIGEHEDAVKLLTTVSKKNDTIYYLISENYFHIANLSDDDNQYFKAIKNIDKSLTQNPQNLNSYILKAKILHNLDKKKEAMTVIINGLKISPQNSKLICYRGIERLSLGDLRGSELDFDQSLNSKDLDSTDISYIFRFKAVNRYNDNLEVKIKNLNKAISYSPKNAINYELRADLYFIKGDTASACEDYSKAIELGNMSVFEKVKETCK